jgi:hypothetical protein
MASGGQTFTWWARRSCELGCFFWKQNLTIIVGIHVYHVSYRI